MPRLHISLNVRDLEESSRFYEILLGAPPAKRRPGYAKFEPAAPALNLALNQVAGSPSGESRVSHLGLEVESRGAVREAAARLARAGLATREEEDVTCCYAVQDKVWVRDPDGNDWEVFTVTDADAGERGGRAGVAGLGCC